MQQMILLFHFSIIISIAKRIKEFYVEHYFRFFFYKNHIQKLYSLQTYLLLILHDFWYKMYIIIDLNKTRRTQETIICFGQCGTKKYKSRKKEKKYRSTRIILYRCLVYERQIACL